MQEQYEIDPATWRKRSNSKGNCVEVAIAIRR